MDTIDLVRPYSYDTLEIHLEEARNAKNHKELAKTYYLMGIKEEQVNDLDQAFEYYTRALDYFKITRDTFHSFLVKEKLANNFRESSLYDESAEQYLELYNYYKATRKEAKEVETLLSLSELKMEQLDFDKSKQYFAQALKISQRINDPTLTLKITLHHADQKLKMREYEKALDYASDAFFLSDSLNLKTYISTSLYYIGIINSKMDNHALATKYLQNSLVSMPGKPMDKKRMGLYRELYLNYERRNVFDSAYIYSVRYARLKDSILNRERLASINNISLRYQAREKSKEVALLEKEKAFAQTQNDQKNRALYALALIMGLLLILIYFIVRFYSTKIQATTIIGDQKEELTRQRIQKLEDEMKIKSMESMIEGQETERERISKDLHDSMGGLLSTIKLQVDGLSSQKGGDTLKEKNKEVQKMLDYAVSEIRSISQNLQPAALKNLGLVAAINDLVNRLDDPRYPVVEFQWYDIADLNNKISLSIYRIIQELLNNSIKHAEAKEIFIQLRQEYDELVLSYEDDGVGFEPAKRQGAGLGLGNIESRVHYLKGELILDSREGEGTSYIIHIPLLHVLGD